MTTDQANEYDIGKNNWEILWAKSDPPHPLWKHLLDAAAVALALPFPMRNTTWTQEMIAFLTGIHDIGKADSCFQHRVSAFSQKLRDAGYLPTGDAPCRHERLSANFAREWLLEKGIPERTTESISQSILAHHGRWENDFRPVGKKYAEAQQQISHMLHNILGSPVPPEEKPEDLSAFGMCLAGHIVLSDWIASNEQFFCDSRLTHLNDPKTYFTEACNVAREWITKLDLARPLSQGKPSCVVKVPRPLQETLLTKDISPGLIIIEAPMGEGKTEAAWILAEKWRNQGYRGMYMALPTMATSDSLFLRYREDYLKQLFPHEKAKLVHGMAWLRDEKEPEKTPEIGESMGEGALAATWFRPTRRAMLAAHGVGTVDQAMLAGMKVKFGFLRLYGLTGRILVIDEVHAYDAYMSAIITHLLQWCSCLKIPVILLSATLSSRQRQDMIEAYGSTGTPGKGDAPYPLITVAESGKEIQTLATAACSSRTLRIELLPGSLGNSKATAKKAEELVQKGGCCCVILNTVKQAQEVYEELQLPEHQKKLFHARFTAKDRQEITEKVLRLFGKDRTNRPEKFVLVATQVVEQSLDVDFDHMISEIAPLDLLLQRSGREHRHQKRAHSPILHILLPHLNSCEKEPDFGNTGYVYAKKPLLRTLALLENHPEMHLPEDFRPLIENCYGTEEWTQNAVAWELIRKEDQEWEKEMQSLQHKGESFALCTPSKRLFSPIGNIPVGDDSDDGNGWRAKTRLGANDRMILLVDETQLESLKEGEIDMKEVRNLYKLTLKLPRYLPIFSPSQGYSSAVKAKGKLQGLILLPLAKNGIWQGEEEGKSYEISYDKALGLIARRIQ